MAPKESPFFAQQHAVDTDTKSFYTGCEIADASTTLNDLLVFLDGSSDKATAFISEPRSLSNMVTLLNLYGQVSVELCVKWCRIIAELAVHCEVSRALSDVGVCNAVVDVLNWHGMNDTLVAQWVRESTR